MSLFRTLALVLLALATIGSASASAEKRVALVVGNAAYRHAVELSNPANDAADMAAVLKDLGFRVIEGRDLDKAGMERILREFAEALVGADVGLFFYAGHGLQVSGTNYLVPVDASLGSAAGLDFEMVRLDLVQRQMEREAKTNVLFLDACRDNPLGRNLARSLGTRSADVGRGLAIAESGVGTLIAFATQPGNVALDGDGRNSPFTAALIRHIATPGQDLSGVLISVRNDVRAATAARQVPWENSALTGRFYFRADASAPPPVPPAASPSLAADDIAWAVVKDSTDPAQVRRFIEQFPASARRAEAVARLAQLERQKVAVVAPPPPSGAEFIVARHAQLNRDCSPVGTPTIRIDTQPRNGTAVVVAGPYETRLASASSNIAKCRSSLGSTVPGIRVVYQPKAGFSGTDTFSYTVTFRQDRSDSHRIVVNCTLGRCAKRN
jgi:uncharacterized caspase-like protein